MQNGLSSDQTWACTPPRSLSEISCFIISLYTDSYFIAYALVTLV